MENNLLLELLFLQLALRPREPLKDSTAHMDAVRLAESSTPPGQKPEGEITEVSYMFPKPGTTAPPVSKVSFVTRVGDLGCGVGYYK